VSVEAKKTCPGTERYPAVLMRSADIGGSAKAEAGLASFWTQVAEQDDVIADAQDVKSEASSSSSNSRTGDASTSRHGLPREVIVHEGGLKFHASPLGGQKTGFYAGVHWGLTDV